MPGLFTELQNFTPQNQNEAKCSFCGQHPTTRLVPLPGGQRESRKARVFRTNLHIHMEGWVELCEWCAEELGVAIGMIRSHAAEGLRVLYEQAVTARDDFEAQVQEKQAMINSLAGELAQAAEAQAVKVAAAYDRGVKQGYEDAKLEFEDDMKDGREPDDASA